LPGALSSCATSQIHSAACLAKDNFGQEIGPIVDWRRRAFKLLEGSRIVWQHIYG